MTTMGRITNLGAGPHFLGIGAQRAGTTWINDMLATNPAVWMPPMKELHFLDAFPRGLDAGPNRQPLRWRRMAGWARQPEWRGVLGRGRHTVGDMLAMARYEAAAHSCGPSLSTYRRLFVRAADRGLVTGEITPAYASLPPAQVHAARKALGDSLKVFLVLRDPVERMWSQATKDVPHALGTESPWPAYAEFIASEACRMRTRYADALDAWREAFGEKNMLVIWFDEIAERPAELMSRLEVFLGVPRKIPAKLLPATNSYRRGEERRPPAIRRCLAEISLEECRRLQQIEPSPYIVRWISRAEEMLSALADSEDNYPKPPAKRRIT